jgi:hypothetical protein
VIIFFAALFCLKGNIFITAGQRPAVMKILPFGQPRKLLILNNNSTSKKDLACFFRITNPYTPYGRITNPAERGCARTLLLC